MLQFASLEMMDLKVSMVEVTSKKVEEQTLKTRVVFFVSS